MSRERVTRSKLIADLKRLNEKNPGNITRNYYRENGSFHESSWQKHFPKFNDFLEAAGIEKAVAAGSLRGTVGKVLPLPEPGKITRYIITSAQNNTYVHGSCWNNLLALAKHYKATILIGTFSYNQNAYGKLSVKAGTKQPDDETLWFDPAIAPYICDERVEIGKGLVWCGEMNIIPTANNPLEGLQTYTGRKSAIFPHAKLAMSSIPTMQGEGVKLNYTTGAVTLRNYIQKKAGLKAEHHHNYGAVVVEVDDNGNWWVRQLEQDDNDTMYDLNVKASSGKVTTGNAIEAITWGDIHATYIDQTVGLLSTGPGGMLDTLKPSYQFIHDLLEGVSVNHHAARNPHEQFKAYLRGYDVVSKELRDTCEVLHKYLRRNVHTVVVDSNHDNWLMRWLREHDYRSDPRNAVLFLEAQTEVYKQLEGQNDKFHLVEWALRRFGCPDAVKFLQADESFTICNKQIECGMHGHLGPNGARGNPANLNRVGRKANTAHTHSAGIYNGLYVAGTSTKLRWDYAKGPSSWTNSHIVTYANGKRAIVTMYAGKWKG